MRMRAGQSSQERPAAVSLFATRFELADGHASARHGFSDGGSVYEALDLNVFNGLCEVFDAQTLAGTYRDLLLQTRQRLCALAADPSPTHFRKVGHTLRGTASMFGANIVALLGTELEHAAETPGRQADLLQRLEAACDELEAALRGRQVRL